MEDLENRNNYRLMGLPENVPMKDLQTLCETDLPRALGVDRRCHVERAHRIGQDAPHRTPSKDGRDKLPRQVIMCFLDFNDKTDILKAFRRRNTTLELKGAKILLFEDFSADVAGHRRPIAPPAPASMLRKSVLAYFAQRHLWSFRRQDPQRQMQNAPFRSSLAPQELKRATHPHGNDHITWRIELLPPHHPETPPWLPRTSDP